MPWALFCTSLWSLLADLRLFHCGCEQALRKEGLLPPFTDEETAECSELPLPGSRTVFVSCPNVAFQETWPNEL